MVSEQSKQSAQNTCAEAGSMHPEWDELWAGLQCLVPAASFVGYVGRRLTPKVTLVASYDAVLVWLSGTAMWRIDGYGTPVGPGQSMFIPRGIVHGFRNEAADPASCLCVLTPGVLGPEYSREFAALLADGKPDPAEMKQVMLRHGLVPCEHG